MTVLPVLPSAAVACCSPVTAGVLDDDQAEVLARMFKALGDPNRVKLLSIIAAAEDKEACVCDLTEPLGLSQPTVSHHMKQLREGGFVSSERRGKWIFYSLVPDQVHAVTDALAL